MTKAMILSMIENMDSWIEKMDDGEDDNNKMIPTLIDKTVGLCSPLVKMADYGEDSKEKLNNFVVAMAAFDGIAMKNLCMFLAEIVCFWEYGKDCSFLVRMKDSGDENMENLYSFLVRIADSVTDNMKRLLDGIADSWKKEQTVNEESMNTFLIAMADLGDDKKENLYNSLVGMSDFWGDHKEKVHGWLIGEGDFLENEERLELYSLLDKKTDLSEVQFEMAGSREDDMEKLYSLQYWLINSLKDNKQTVNNAMKLLSSSWIDQEMYRSLADFCEYNKEKLSTPYVLLDRITDFCKVEVGMTDSREDNMQKLLNLLVSLEESWHDNEEKLVTLYSVVNDLEEGITEKLCSSLVDFCEDHKEKLYQSQIETGDFLENEKKLKLYILLDKMTGLCETQVEMAHSREYYMPKSYNQLLHMLVNSWEDSKETMNYESLYSFLDDLGEHEQKLYKEKLYSLLEDLCKDHKEKLRRSLIGNGDIFENEKKLELYILLDRMMDFCEYNKENLHILLVRVEDHWKDNKETLFGLLIRMTDFGEHKKENLYNLVVEMADLWEHNKEMLYSLLVRVWTENMHHENMYYSFLLEMTDFWKDQPIKENLHSFLLEMTDLWEDQPNKENLHSLLVEAADILSVVKHGDYNNDKLHSLLVEMAGLWKGNLINKVKLYSWLAKKADHNYKLFHLLLRVVLLNEETNEYNRRTIEEVRNYLREILDLLTDKKLQKEEEEEEGSSLHYLMSEVLEIATDALFIQVLDSDPIVLLSQIFNAKIYHHIGFNHAVYKFNKRTSPNAEDGLKKMKEHILQLRVGRGMTAENVGKFVTREGGESLVGLEEDIKLLLHNENIHTVTYIRGMGGIGKTTLARELYNHPSVVNKFECRAWVRVSQQLSRKDLLINLLRQVGNGKEYERDVSLEKMDNESLIRMLHQHMKCMRHFIVFDDMPWDIYMNYVFESLPEENGSRLLFTTRIPGVSFTSSKDGHYINHKMKFLDDDKSWELLLKTLFAGTSNQNFPKHLKKKGRQMLEKCSGLPLAIKEVGRQWADMLRSGSKWEELLESMDLSATLEVLDTSYHDWRDEVKSRFLFLALFKEGATIRVKKLVHIWTIGGVDPGFQLYCLSELSRESIIQFKDTTKNHNKFKTCRVNPLFQRLSIKRAQDEISLEIVKGGSDRCSNEPRHRVIYCSREKFDYSTNQDKQLVSLLFFGGGYIDINPSYWQSFEKLEILDMEDFGLKILPDAVGKLIELRYLGLRNNYIQELPPSLRHLKRLEVLDIEKNFMIEVADIIWEMESLHHLYMSNISCKKPLKIDSLKNLETLTYISVDGWTYELSSLEIMSSLCQLGIEEVDVNSNISRLFSSLTKLCNLKFLTLRGLRFRRMPSLDELGILKNLSELKLDGLLTRLPGVSNFPPYIKYLILVNSCLHEDPMPILEKLLNLEYLKLHNAYTGQQLVILPGGFPCLEYMIIEELWHLRNIQVGERGLLCLKELEINNCPYLETLPEEITLKELKMVTTKTIAKKIRKCSFTRMQKVDIQP